MSARQTVHLGELELCRFIARSLEFHGSAVRDAGRQGLPPDACDKIPARRPRSHPGKDGDGDGACGARRAL